MLRSYGILIGVLLAASFVLIAFAHFDGSGLTD